MTTAMTAVTDRITGVVLARLRGPKIRQGTRFWTEKPGTKSAGPTLEFKALDGDIVVPDSLVGEIDEAMRPVALRVARDAASDTARRLGPPLTGDTDDGMFAVDDDLLAGLIDDALADLAGVASRYVGDLRQAVLDGDVADNTIDDLLGEVEQVARRGANRLNLDARTLGTALAASASLEQALALGATTTQWISRRDERVRLTHRLADGQVREIGDAFRVGRHELDYPGDPSGLPGTAEEVMGCRCGLLFSRPDPRVRDALAATAAAEAAPGAADGVAQVFTAAARSTDYVPVPDAGALGVPALGNEITLTDPVVGWRLLTVDGPDLRAGQRIEIPEGTALGLAAPTQRGVATMSVLIPAGVQVALSGGAIVLLDTVVTTVLAASAAGLQTAMF